MKKCKSFQRSHVGVSEKIKRELCLFLRNLLQCGSKIPGFKMKARGIHLWIIKYSFMWVSTLKRRHIGFIDSDSRSAQLEGPFTEVCSRQIPVVLVLPGSDRIHSCYVSSSPLFSAVLTHENALDLVILNCIYLFSVKVEFLGTDSHSWCCMWGY